MSQAGIQEPRCVDRRRTIRVGPRLSVLKMAMGTLRKGATDGIAGLVLRNALALQTVTATDLQMSMSNLMDVIATPLPRTMPVLIRSMNASEPPRWQEDLPQRPAPMGVGHGVCWERVCIDSTRADAHRVTSQIDATRTSLTAVAEVRHYLTIEVGHSRALMTDQMSGHLDTATSIRTRMSHQIGTALPKTTPLRDRWSGVCFSRQRIPWRAWF